MEGLGLLDVPITEQERRQRDNFHQRLLSFSDTSDDVRYNEIEPDKEATLSRFGSLRTAVQRVNDNGDATNPPIFHQRIPSNPHNEPQLPFNFQQPTNYDRQTNYARLDYPPDLWRPFWTRKSTLSALLCLLLAIVIALVLLWHYSESLDGFNVSSSTAYYAWTFAPVAFMVVLITLWRQVDYYFKLLAPWEELRNGPVSAPKSLLLDYVSPTNIVSFLTAFKRRYIPVMLSITAFFSLKVTAIFSAALFVRSSTIVTSNSTSAFSSRVFDASSLTSSAVPNISSFSSIPVYSALGNLAYGVPLEAGVGVDNGLYYTYNPVYLSPDAGKYLENATYVTKTDAFFPNLSCTPVSATIGAGSGVARANQTTVGSTNNYITLRIPSGKGCSNWASPKVYAMNPQREKTPPQQLEGTMQTVYCAGDQNNTQHSEPAGLLFTITDIHYAQTVLGNGTIVNSTRMVYGVSNLLCSPGYYMLDAKVTNDTALYGPNALNVQMSGFTNKTIDGLSNKTLATLYEGIMNASQGVFGTRQENPQASSVPNTVFDLMRLQTNASSLEPFTDPQKMKVVAENTFRHVMAHYTAQSLTKETQTNSTAATVYSRDRLHVSLAPFGVVLALIALSACCTAGLIWVTPGPLVPKDPSMIAMSATVLSRSPELNRLLRKQANEGTTMANAMSEHQFSSAIATTELGQRSFKVLVAGAEGRSALPSQRATQIWWSPNLTLLPAVCAAILVPVALIVILEVLQHRSDDHQGLLSLNVETYTALYARCIPVLVMMLLAATVEYLDFFVELMSPWNKLASGNTSARRSLLSHLLGKLPPASLIEGIRERHFGAVFSISASILASMFAVIAAGLYTVQDISAAGSSQQMIAADSFDLSRPYNALNDLGAAGMLYQIDHANVPYPEGTYNNLLFSTYLQTQKQNLSAIPTHSLEGPLNATIPALRANLRCDVVPSQNIQSQYVSSSQRYPSDRYDISSRYNLPHFCQFGGQAGESATVILRNRFNITRDAMTTYGGQLLDLRFGENSSVSGHYGENNSATVGDNPASGCPSLAFTLAEFNTESNSSQITTLFCYQQIQQLDATVVFKTNSSQLDLQYPPKIDESKLSLLANTNSTNGAKSFDWRIQRNVERQLYGLDAARLRSSNTSETYQFDAFFSYLFNNTYNQSPATLVGSSNEQALISVVNMLYSRYMAQAINANMRVPTNSTNNGIHKRQSSSSTVTADTTTNQTRLVQSSTSKLVLQILLGLSILFSSLAYILVSFRHLIPHNPCTIAGTMSLLAGSDLCWTPDDALCDCCGRTRLSSWSHEPVDMSEETIVNADPSEYQNTPILNGHRQQTIPDATEWMDYVNFAAVFAARKYSLGWWREDRLRGRRRRFGVDIGGRPDGEMDDDWELGGRRPHGEQGFENFMMRGRDMLGVDQRGQYQRANRAELSPDPGPNFRAGPHASGAIRASSSSPTLNMSPITNPAPTTAATTQPTPLRSSPILGHGAGHGPSTQRYYVSMSPSDDEITGVRSPRKVRFDDADDDDQIHRVTSQRQRRQQ